MKKVKPNLAPWRVVVEGYDVVDRIATYIWSGINPATNRWESSTRQPTIDNTFWQEFEYCSETHPFELAIYKSREDYVTYYGGEYVICWNDGDDSYLHKGYPSLEAAIAEWNMIMSATYYSDQYEWLQLLEFNYH